MSDTKALTDERIDELRQEHLDWSPKYGIEGHREFARAIEREVRLSLKRSRAAQRPADEGCICAGNWRAIVRETEHLIGRRFLSHDGKTLTYFGPIHGGEDYYYGMWLPGGGDGSLRMLSCVGDIEWHGYTLIEGAPVDERSPAASGLDATARSDETKAVVGVEGSEVQELREALRAFMAFDPHFSTASDRHLREIVAERRSSAPLAKAVLLARAALAKHSKGEA